MPKLDINSIKKDFPILTRQINGNRLAYLDNAATSQRPAQVVNALTDFYFNHNANVHRGLHTLSEEATELYELSRRTTASFIGAAHPQEITFTKGTTESINRIAFEWGLENLHKGDVILTTDAEHHSNLIPWQIVSQRTGAVLDFVEVNAQGELPLEKWKEKLTDKVRLVAVTHASNVLGTIHPIKEITKLAHAVGAKVAVDGAQAVPHLEVNMQSLGCDFYSFSGHKMLAPTGIGVLWIKKEILETLEPYEYGGGMIDIVSYSSATYADIPEKFEAGTPNIAGAIGLRSAIDYLTTLGMNNVREHEVELNAYALDKLCAIPQVHVLGPMKAEARTGLVSFTVDKVHAHDVASVLNSVGVAVRSGHHCNMPLHQKLHIPATTRASYYLYNTKEDIDALVSGIEKAVKLLG